MLFSDLDLLITKGTKEEITGSIVGEIENCINISYNI
jgi:hypothetical protein